MKRFLDDDLSAFRTRRQFLREASCGFGSLALAATLGRTPVAQADSRSSRHEPLASRAPHFEPRAKRVIFLHMLGAPSQQDTFDYKTELAKDPWRHRFSQHGESGLSISDLYPHLAHHADDLCLLNGMFTDLPAHKPATMMLHTGSAVFSRPSVGSWVLYGLGTENENLPGFIAMNMPHNAGGAGNYGTAFLPASYEGTALGGLRSKVSKGDLAHMTNGRWSRQMQRRQLDLARKISERARDRNPEDIALDGIIESSERAFRMQMAMPEVMDFEKEPQHIKDLYGIGGKRRMKAEQGTYATTDGFARQCLLARRLAEAGVRFIEITDSYWDTHTNQHRDVAARAFATDKPIAALLSDLKERGLLDDTLVVWGGEFGRKVGDPKKDGSEHNETGFTMWMAGGGVRGGIRYGATNETGETAVEGRMHIHDLHATILHLLGLDHERLTYRYAGRDFRLTDVHGNVAREIMS